MRRLGGAPRRAEPRAHAPPLTAATRMRKRAAGCRALLLLVPCGSLREGGSDAAPRPRREPGCPVQGSASGTAWRAARDAVTINRPIVRTPPVMPSFQVSLRSSAMVVRLDPVGVLGARRAVLAHERAVDRWVHEHQGGGHSAFGGEIRSHALPSRLSSDSACAAAATGSTSAACPRPDRPRRIRRPEADSYSALSRCWRPGAGCSSRP